METQVELQTLQPAGELERVTTCLHGRIIDDILTRGGKRTGKVRCLECGTKIDDPYHSVK